ncbi:MAG: glycine oxidase ThiO [Pyrinomonadaceae bacterium]
MSAVSNDKYDVIVAGGGVIGLAIARELRKNGVRRIAIVESGMIGREASFAAAGMLAPQAETDSPDTFFRFCMESNTLFPAFAAELKDETGIDIELDRTGTLYLAFDKKDEADAATRLEWQKAAGLAVERLNPREIKSLEPAVSPNVRSGLFFPNDGQVENRLLVAALAAYAKLNDIEVLENRRIESIILDGRRVVGVGTAAGKFFADTVVLATGAWTSLIEIGGSGLPIVRPIHGQMICFATSGVVLRHVVYGKDVYLVPRADGRILAGATVEDVGFRKDITDGAVEVLRAAAYAAVPRLSAFDVADRWSGLRPCSPDTLPVLGAVAGIEGLHIATAHYRNGILLSPLTAKLIAAAICRNARSAYLDEFSATRFAVVSASAAF